MGFAGDGTGVFAEIEAKLGPDAAIVRSPQEVEDVFDAADVDLGDDLDGTIFESLRRTGWLTDEDVATATAVECLIGAVLTHRPEPDPAATAPPDGRPAPAPQGPHALLGVRPYASWAEVYAAYRRRARRVHPDHVGPGEREAAEAAMVELNAALAALRAGMRGPQ